MVATKSRSSLSTVGSRSLLQGIFPIQGLNPGLSHCWRVLYQLSHQGSPRILEWVAYPFSSGSSRPRNRTQVSRIAGRSLMSELQGSPSSSPHSSKLILVSVDKPQRQSAHHHSFTTRGQYRSTCAPLPTPALKANFRLKKSGGTEAGTHCH